MLDSGNAPASGERSQVWNGHALQRPPRANGWIGHTCLTRLQCIGSDLSEVEKTHTTTPTACRRLDQAHMPNPFAME